MEQNAQKKKLKIKIIISFIFLIILVVLFFLLSNKKELNMVTKVDPEIGYEQGELETENNTNTEVVETVDKYRQEVAGDVIVPELDTQLNEEQKNEIAVPKIVVPSASGSESSFRSFDIRAENNSFIPNKIIAKVGDVIHVNFSAIDGDYDIVFPSYNMKQIAKTGQTKILEFQAVEGGNFLYYCEACGGEDGDVKGNIIIVE